MTSWLLQIHPRIREIWQGAWLPGTLEPDRYLYDHELVLVTEGSCRIVIGAVALEVGADEAVIVPPGSRHRSVAGPQGATRFCVHFHWVPETRRTHQPIWCFFPRRPRRGSVTPAPRFVPDGIVGRIHKAERGARLLTGEILRRWASGKEWDRALCHAQFLELLLRILGTEEHARQDAARPLAYEVKALLDGDLTTPIQTLLPTLGFSYAHLCRIFHGKFGMTPVEYRNAVRLEKVRDLLLHSRLTIAEIADRTGFVDPAYLTRLFRRRYGCPPSFYRETR
jgi:AraC-type DNA-binding domain-containing proteins